MSNDTANAGPVLPEPPRLASGQIGHYPNDIRAYGRQCWNACAEQVAGPLRERIAELEDCLRKSIGIADGLRETRDDLKAEIARLRAENEALRADAERYRWLRDEGPHRPGGRLPVLLGRYCEELDAAIDAARAAREGA